MIVTYATDPTRELLFGVIALKVGLIDTHQLDTAVRAWKQGGERTLAEHLESLADDQRAAVETMVDVHERKHGGDVAKCLDAIDADRSTRAILAQIDDADAPTLLTRSNASETQTAQYDEQALPTTVGSATSDGQRFRLLRPHASGGLGTVFVALDVELHREVALKQLLDQHADDPSSARRFLLEAEITGGLEHPGIVPVYGLGTHGDGRPFYAMRFIRGDSLKDAIAHFHTSPTLKTDLGRRSLELRQLLRRFTDVCNTIDYAHSRSVIHRDIKPGNIVLGKHGETLVVDWGLAKALGKPDPTAAEMTLQPTWASGSAETLPGSMLGTPAYMSPEQAAGDLDRVGPRSDVYSLGATLYCLLTGKPPFSGNVADVIIMARNGDFPPPRQLDPTIDQALDAICLKAMSLRPDDRYSTPRELNDDLERWTADEPVTAWNEPLPRRARRWARRNRTAMTVAAATVLVALAGMGSVVAVQTTANQALKFSNDALKSANNRVIEANSSLQASNDREKQRFVLAMEAIKLFHGEVSEDLLLKRKEFESLRTKLLRGAAGFYERLETLLKGQQDLLSRAALAKAYRELGDLTAQIGNQPEALAVDRKALAVWRELASRPGADLQTNLDLARTLLATGVLQEDSGDSGSAMTAYEEGRAILRKLAHDHPTATAVRRELAICSRSIGWLLSNLGRPDDALNAYNETRAIIQELVNADPTNTQFQRDLGATDGFIAILFSDTGRAAKALAAYEQARLIQQKLVDANPSAPGIQSELATTCTNLALLLSESAEPARAMALRTSARDPAGHGRRESLEHGQPKQPGAHLRQYGAFVLKAG